MTATVAAMVVAILLSELAFDTRDIAYWRRWLGRFGYRWRRALLMLVPAVLALGVQQAAPDTTSIAAQLMVGAAAGVTAAAVLRADTRGHTRIRSGRSDHDQMQVASALSWMYRQVCRRYDARARAGIDRFLRSLRNETPGDPQRLLQTAEEIEGVISQELTSVQKTGPRKELQKRLDTLREQMDLVVDPLAEPRDRRRASHQLSESIAEEMSTRRWNRPPAHHQR
ncbi:hypothetical protein GTY40_04335 [Streptomyces sp. SID8359]|uniref:hypothetical protein n=1 Tax=unclassified Streptomyces TaxID=2593676 RepID=UPI0012FE99E0|nr:MULTISPECIES: hypothetical protein [unclassified Streptomyces]MYT90279.1 hypothetical protein [Streptomyces sp. SID8359]